MSKTPPAHKASIGSALSHGQRQPSASYREYAPKRSAIAADKQHQAPAHAPQVIKKAPVINMPVLRPVPVLVVPLNFAQLQHPRPPILLSLPRPGLLPSARLIPVLPLPAATQAGMAAPSMPTSIQAPSHVPATPGVVALAQVIAQIKLIMGQSIQQLTQAVWIQGQKLILQNKSVPQSLNGLVAGSDFSLPKAWQKMPLPSLITFSPLALGRGGSVFQAASSGLMRTLNQLMPLTSALQTSQPTLPASGLSGSVVSGANLTIEGMRPNLTQSNPILLSAAESAAAAPSALVRNSAIESVEKNALSLPSFKMPEEAASSKPPVVRARGNEAEPLVNVVNVQNLTAAHQAKELSAQKTLASYDFDEMLQRTDEEKSDDAYLLKTARFCPLCGQANHCALPQPGGQAQDCWCHQLPLLSPSLLKSQGLSSQDGSCICLNCATQLLRSQGLLPTRNI